MPSSPWPQALQAALARPGPPFLAPGRRAGTQAHTSRRSRERGLGQTQSLRSRSNVAVQQVLGTPPGRGQAHRRRLTHRAHACIYIDIDSPPHTGRPQTGPQPLPNCADGATKAPSGTGAAQQLWLEVA